MGLVAVLLVCLCVYILHVQLCCCLLFGSRLDWYRPVCVLPAVAFVFVLLCHLFCCLVVGIPCFPNKFVACTELSVALLMECNVGCAE